MSSSDNNNCISFLILYFNVFYNYKYRIPKSTLYYEAAEEAKQKWQDEWTTRVKAAATKQYFPTAWDRLGIKINLTPNLGAILTGHGRTRAYLHRFNRLTLNDPYRVAPKKCIHSLLINIFGINLKEISISG